MRITNGVPRFQGQKFHYPRVSPGDQPLTKSWRNSGLEIAIKHASLLPSVWLLNAREGKLSGGRVHEEELPNSGPVFSALGPLRSRKCCLFSLFLLLQREFLLFSLLSTSFNEQQDHALSDYLQASVRSVMLQYKNPAAVKLHESVHLIKPSVFI